MNNVDKLTLVDYRLAALDKERAIIDFLQGYSRANEALRQDAEQIKGIIAAAKQNLT